MNLLLKSVVFGITGIQGVALAAEPRPKLVVGIMVDQLRTDYLENMKDMFVQGGFRRLMDNGVYFKDIDYIIPVKDATVASAIIQSGSYPRYTGVTGKTIYDPSVKSENSLFKDPNYIGNFTDETYSPAALRVTTLTDEIAVDNKGKGQIHSLSPDAAESIVLAGHAGNSAFWVNEETGRWSSTTYYPNPPASIQNRNYNEPLISRIDTMKWVPMRKGEPYVDVSAQEIKEGFKYTFSRSDRDVFALYKNSPFVNSDITQIATEYISDLKLGTNPETIDVLNLGYNLSPYPGAMDGDYKYLLQDAYLRLDRDLEVLFNNLDKKVGKENVLVYLFSTGYFTEPETDTHAYRLPGGIFSVKRSMSLLNAYLSAKYGNGAYVDQYSDNHIYLDKNVIEEKGLDLFNVAEDSRDFLVKMSGVSDAGTSMDYMSASLPQHKAQRLAIDPKTSGDIILEFNPGWKVIDDSKYPSQNQITTTAAYSAPGFIMGTGISPQIKEETVEATAIAPTLASALRIRSPNSTKDKPINL